MNCASCEGALPPGAKFCPHCGQAVVARCASCSAELIPGARFCSECGTPTGATPIAKAAQAPLAITPAAVAAPADRAPASYTPKHLADRILQSRSALEGERKQVTVLFADVKGSMELAEQLDPEEWHRILERFFAILTEGVHRFEGTVNQYTGDGIMALFGAPIAHEDHAQRACYAALALRDALRIYGDELRVTHGLNFGFRIGMNSGEVVVGRIGDDLRMDYTAQGHTVGLAQRMESLAEPNTCFVSATTAALAGGYVALDDLGEFRVKGVAEPVHVHRLVGFGSARTRLDVSGRRGLSRFVGRAADIRTLEDALEAASTGLGQVIGVVAEAGTGKSRLCFEFLERCRARGLRVLLGRAVAHGRNIPFLPILEIFRAYFDIAVNDDDRVAREKIAGRVVLLDAALSETLPTLFEFLGVADPARPVPAISPEARQRVLIGVLRRVVHGAEQPTVTMIEDLHWLDAPSGEFIAHLVDARADSRSLLLLNFRPEYRAEWMQKSWYRQVPLTPLTPHATAELLGDLLGADASLAPLASSLHARTAGNPFFTEEVVWSLVESGQLLGARGAYRLVRPIEQLDVPATVQAVLAARIDRLQEREKRLLQMASVIGKDFPETLLAAISDLPTPEMKASLAALQEAEFIHELAIYPSVEYSFRHPLTQEVTLGSLLRERRRTLHASVAVALEAAGGNLDEKAALLAQHWEQAADAAQAVRWHARAAQWVGVNDPVQEVQHWMKVRVLGRALDDLASRELRLLACKSMLGGASFRLDLRAQEVRDCLDEWRVLSESLGTPTSEMAFLLASVAASEFVRGRVSAALQWSEEARSLVTVDMDRLDRVWVLIASAISHLLAGRLEGAIATFDEIGVFLGDDENAEVNGIKAVIFARCFSAKALAAMGRFEACWQRLARAFGWLRDAHTTDTFNFTVNTFAMSAYLAGGTQGSDLPDLTRASLECVEHADPKNLSTSLHAPLYLATARFLAGEFADADDGFTEGLARMRAVGMSMEWHCAYAATHADVCRSLGAFDRAAAVAREGIAFADEGGLRFQAALCRVALADALLASTAPDAVVASVVAQAHALAESTGGQALLPRLRETEVRLAARREPKRLLSGLQEVEAMYRGMGALGHADRLLREIAPGMSERSSR